MANFRRDRSPRSGTTVQSWYRRGPGAQAILWLLVLWAPVASFGYGDIEIVQILMASMRLHDPAVMKAAVVLRNRHLLEAQSSSLADLVDATQTPEVMNALRILGEHNLIPDAQTSPGSIADELIREKALQKEDEERQIEKHHTVVLSEGRVVRCVPYYVYIQARKIFMLGGLRPADSELEVSYERPDGIYEVMFPSLKRAFVDAKYVQLAPEVSEADTQEAGQVEIVEDVPCTIEHRRHNGASLHVLHVHLDPEGAISIAPVVTGQYDLRVRGGDKVLGIEEIARRTGALAAINGTFFLNQPRKPFHGKPLAPIIAGGRLVWSYREKRVLDMDRCYLAITDHNRAVIGQTRLTAEEILAQARRGEFDPELFRGERLVHLLGGLGRLVLDGHSTGWRLEAGTQFGLSYYSRYVHRPQTVLGISRDGRDVTIIVQEGKPYSVRPMTLPELARYLVANFHVYEGVFLDGGGSSQLVANGRSLTHPEGNGHYRANSTALAVLGRG